MSRCGALVALPSWLFSFVLAAQCGAISIEIAIVNNAANLADSTGVGAVAYAYRIAKHEVTNAQYVEFLNAVDPAGANALALYDSEMTTHVMGGIEYLAGNVDGQKYGVKPGRANNPVGFVSWYDAIRMANWMHHGQGSGDTETGAYTLGALGAGAVPVNGAGIGRNVGASWFLPSDDEWYKAAYHQPVAQGGDADDYWSFPTASNDSPFSAPPPGVSAPQPANTANYFYNDLGPAGYNDGFAVTGSHVFDSLQNYLTDVGAYADSRSFYGTFDQAGNAYEWNEQPYADGLNRELRGSSWAATGLDDRAFLSASSRNGLNPATGSFPGVGFRLAAVVPEPHAAAILVSAIVLLVDVRRRTPRGGLRNVVGVRVWPSSELSTTCAGVCMPSGNDWRCWRVYSRSASRWGRSK